MRQPGGYPVYVGSKIAQFEGARGGWRGFELRFVAIARWKLQAMGESDCFIALIDSSFLPFLW